VASASARGDSVTVFRERHAYLRDARHRATIGTLLGRGDTGQLGDVGMTPYNASPVAALSIF